MIEFQGWPKTPRLFRDMIVTEKIDGTNSAVIIRKLEDEEESGPDAVAEVKAGPEESFDTYYEVAAQSRKRLITPGKTTDNHGFAAWVRENAAQLVKILGPGRHFGEWWGSGIQRGYGLQNGEKRFSLFNVLRYGPMLAAESIFEPRCLLPELDVVPTLYTGPFNLDVVEGLLAGLMNHGSHAAPGFMNPEGVVVFHQAAGQVFKATLENDETPKELAA